LNRRLKFQAAAIALLFLASGNSFGQTTQGAEARLKEKNIALPAPSPLLGNYVYAVQTGKLLFVSGTVSEMKGKVGKDLTVDQAYQAARQAGLTCLARVRSVIGNLDRIKRVVKVSGMVNSAEDFGDQPKVINGISDLLVEVFGEATGKHSRLAVGMAALPNNGAVEVELILELE
jgi:enamine deaminase RidA (YjgF/YER057c/UK114 family)